MILEAAYSMLACMRLGAVHSVVFGGFSPEAIRSRINDADCRYVITADEGIRGGKRVPLKKNVDIALEGENPVEKVIVKKYTSTETNWDSSRDICYDDLVSKQEKFCECVHLKACLLYTSDAADE